MPTQTGTTTTDSPELRSYVVSGWELAGWDAVTKSKITHYLFTGNPVFLEGTVYAARRGSVLRRSRQ